MMSVQYLIKMLENRLSFAQSQRESAVQRGDVSSVESIDADIYSTQETLAQLRTLL